MLVQPDQLRRRCAPKGAHEAAASRLQSPARPPRGAARCIWSLDGDWPRGRRALARPSCAPPTMLTARRPPAQQLPQHSCYSHDGKQNQHPKGVCLESGEGSVRHESRTALHPHHHSSHESEGSQTRCCACNPLGHAGLLKPTYAHHYFTLVPHRTGLREESLLRQRPSNTEIAAKAAPFRRLRASSA
jgi:hypothetical protein